MKPLEDVLKNEPEIAQIPKPSAADILNNTPIQNETNEPTVPVAPKPSAANILNNTPEENGLVDTPEPEVRKPSAADILNNTPEENGLVDTPEPEVRKPSAADILNNTPEENGLVDTPEPEVRKPSAADILNNTPDENGLVDTPEIKKSAANEQSFQNNDLRYSVGSNIDEVNVKIDPQKKKYVLKFPKKVDKIRLNLTGKPGISTNNVENMTNIDEKYVEFIRSGEEAPVAYDEYRPLSRFEKAKQRQIIDSEKCIIQTKGDYLNTSILYKHFPKNSKKTTFDIKTIDCNYKMMQMVMQDFNGQFFDDIDIPTIKKMLIKFYTPYVHNNDVNDDLFKKLTSEGKGQYFEALKIGKTTIQKIIMDSMYKLTETDVILLSFELNIPLTIVYHAQEKIKLATFKKHQRSFSFSYYMKPTKKNIFYLISNKGDFRFLDEKMSTEWIENRNKQSFDTFEDYIMTSMRR